VAGLHRLGPAGIIALLVLGMALVFRFSWSRVAERIGAACMVSSSRAVSARSGAGPGAGQRAAREREEVVPKSARLIEEHHPAPVLIEPVVRGSAQERARGQGAQKPLFTELPDSKLPQVDLLDGAQARQETVSPETLEMTSRMIEKKLKDFGVEVRVVLARPGR
jgi:S-DNA-T family DNA segregation ATPase FtsK/SpoIIIE